MYWFSLPLRPVFICKSYHLLHNQIEKSVEILERSLFTSGNRQKLKRDA